MASWEFPASEPVELRVRIPSGTVTVAAAPAHNATVRLEGAEAMLGVTRVEFDSPVLSVVTPDHAGRGSTGSEDVTVELPEGSSCLVDTASADILFTGVLSGCEVHTASGDVNAERITGTARIDTASGNVLVGEAGEVQAETASGDISINRARGEATIRTASGDVHIGEAAGRRTDVKATSGDISVAVAPGIGVYLDLSSLSGTVSSELEPSPETGGAEMTLHCRTISGDVRIGRAAGDPRDERATAGGQA